MKVGADSTLANRDLKTLRQELDMKFLICAVEREQEVVIPGGDFIIMPEDKIYIIAGKADIVQFFKRSDYTGRARKTS